MKRQKKTTRPFLTAFLAAFATSALLGGVPAFGADPEWILNNGPDWARVDVEQCNFASEVGLTQIVATGGDAKFSIPLGDDGEFSADERPFFALRYKITSTQTLGGLFYTTDRLTALSDESYSPFPIVPDGTWRDLVLDMRSFRNENWSGTVRSFRLDPTNPSEPGATFAISRLGFFPNEEAARAFLKAANDAPNYATETTFVGPRQRCVVPGGVLSDGYNRDDYLLKSAPTAEDIKTQKIALEELVVVSVDASGKKKIEPLCDATRLGFATFTVSKPGEYRLERSESATRFSDVSGRASEKDVRFVVARKLMFGVNDKTFQPTRKLTTAEGAALLAKFKELGLDAETLKTRIDNLAKNPLTREDAARLVARAVRTKLGTQIDSNFAPSHFTRDRIRLGAWANFRAQNFDAAAMKAYRDCGFDFMIAISGVETKELLQFGNQYGVEIYVNDGSYLTPTEAPAEYCDYPSFSGCYVFDEPGTESFDALAAKSAAYANAAGKTPYVNLLPMYANAAQLKYGAGAAAIEYYDADPDLYRKYCESFCEKFDVNYLCTDIYPLNWVDGKKTTYADYVESINIAASVARRYDREFWCFIQTFGWIPSKRTPTEAEYRWQCYSMLSFGCKNILCWTYAGYEEEFPSLVDVEGRRTRAWYDIRPVLAELRRLSDEYVKYRNIGAYTRNCTDETPYLRMSDPCEFPTIREIQCDDPLLIGCFERKKSAKTGPQTAFVVTNMTELGAEKGTSVRVKLNGSKAVAWYRGVPEKLATDADGYFEIQLASGEGVFVTVEK